MKIPMYERCCCIFSLETGCKIIGIVQAVFSLLLLIYKSIALDSLMDDLSAAPDEEKVPTGVLVPVAVIMILVSLVQFVLGILLFYSVGKKNSNIPKIWVYVETTLISCTFVLLIMMSVWVSSYAEDSGAGFTNFLCGVLLLSVMAYIVNVVYSYHRSTLVDPDPAASAPALDY